MRKSWLRVDAPKVGKMNNIGISAWDDGDYVVTYNGAPIGQALSKLEADRISVWLRSAIVEILVVHAKGV